MIHTTVSRTALLVALSGIGLAFLTGCSSASSSGGSTSATPPKGSPSSVGAATKAPTSGATSASLAAGECTEASILAALPVGSTMDKYQCAIVSPWMWAAARVKPGARVFFLQSKTGAWKVYTPEKVCGANKAGLPKEILAFCPEA